MTRDCMVYALAVRQLVDVELDRWEAKVATKAAPIERPPVIRSTWMNGD